MSKTLKGLFLFTDIGFILYWIVTVLALIPKEYLYQDYISITGMYSIYLDEYKVENRRLNFAHPDILFRTAGDRFLDHEDRFRHYVVGT